jgi:hypothetical protein
MENVSAFLEYERGELRKCSVIVSYPWDPLRANSGGKRIVFNNSLVAI